MALTGCGFHLRGSVDVPTWLNQVAVINENAHRDLKPLLIEALTSYHISVDPSPKKANYILIIENDSIKEQMTSVSSTTTSRQYQLIYQVFFKLITASGVEIIPHAQVTVIRQLTVNYNQILGSNQEGELLKSEMRNDAVTQILFRISRHKNMPIALKI